VQKNNATMPKEGVLGEFASPESTPSLSQLIDYDCSRGLCTIVLVKELYYLVSSFLQYYFSNIFMKSLLYAVSICICNSLKTAQTKVVAYMYEILFNQLPTNGSRLTKSSLLKLMLKI